MKLSFHEILKTQRVLTASRPTPRTPWERILVPVNFTDESREALKLAVSLAADPEDRITLLHVIEREHWLQRGNAVTMILRRDEEDLHRDAEKGLERWARQEAGPDIAVETVVRSGRLVEEILRVAETRESDLIVLAAPPKNWLVRLFRRDVSRKLQRKAPCAVVSIRPPANSPRLPVHFEPEVAWRKPLAARPQSTAPVSVNASWP